MGVVLLDNWDSQTYGSSWLPVHMAVSVINAVIPSPMLL